MPNAPSMSRENKLQALLQELVLYKKRIKKPEKQQGGHRPPESPARSHFPNHEVDWHSLSGQDKMESTWRIVVKKYSVLLGTLLLSLLFDSLLSARSPAVKGYRNVKAMNRELRALASSKHASYRSLARTRRRNDIGLLTVGTENADQRPAVLIVSGVDPTRRADAEVTLRVARRMVESAKSDSEFRNLLDHVTFYIIAQVAPDGAEAFFQEPHRERHVNARPIDDDTDGRVDEDGPDDLNGDELITMMRVEDPEGEYIVHPDDDRVLIKAKSNKGERGRYSLYVEGRDNDGDGKLNEDPPGGVAFDQNFPFNYDYFSQGAGPHQVSEIETRASADFAFNHPNIVLVWTLSDRDNLLRKWEPDKNAERNRIKKTLLAEDEQYFNEFVELYKDIQDKGPENGGADGKGAWVEWAYFHYGRWSIATNPWRIPDAKPKDNSKSDAQEEKKQSDSKKEKEQNPENGTKDDSRRGDSTDKPRNSPQQKRGAEELQALAWFKQAGIDGFVPWQPIKHADLAEQRVDVGGFRPFLRQNPPVDRLDHLAADQYDFLVKLCDLLPRVKISKVKTESLGSGVWRVTARVVNEGVLPTVSEMGRITGVPRRLQVELDPPGGVKLVTGHCRRSIAPLAGNGGQHEEKWLVRGPADKKLKLKIQVWSPMVQRVNRTVVLER